MSDKVLRMSDIVAHTDIPMPVSDSHIKDGAVTS